MKEYCPICSHEKWSDLDSWYWYKNAFTDEEIEKIIKITQGFSSQTAKAGGDTTGEIKETRSSTIKWMDYNDDTAWIYQKLGEYIKSANEKVWKFNWEGHIDTLQYTEYYDSAKGKYDWHIDVGDGSMSMRKISAVLLLNDGYEGGELQIKNIGENMEGNKGDLYIFPSFLMHRVTTVTKGTRKSLVLSAGGPEPFK